MDIERDLAWSWDGIWIGDEIWDGIRIWDGLWIWDGFGLWAWDGYDGLDIGRVMDTGWDMGLEVWDWDLHWAVGPGCGVGIEVRMWDVKKCALFTGGSCGVVGKHCRWKAAVWSPTG